MDRAQRKSVREFGIAVGVILALVSLIRFWRGHEPHFAWMLGIGGAAALAGLFAPRALHPVFRVWMVIARGLLWFNTRLILSLIYFLVVTPIALGFRIAGRDLLERRFDRGAKTYWRPRAAAAPGPERFRKQF